MRSFEALDYYNIDGKGTFAVVRLDVEMREFRSMIGERVMIDGKEYEIRAVEFQLHSPPYRVGEKVGLQLRECEK